MSCGRHTSGLHLAGDAKPSPDAQTSSQVGMPVIIDVVVNDRKAKPVRSNERLAS